MTRHDARLSAIRAFSFSEMRDLALQAGWENFGHQKFCFARQAIWLETGVTAFVIPSEVACRAISFMRRLGGNLWIYCVHEQLCF